MTHEEFDKMHCSGCRQDCSFCVDAFLGEQVMYRKSFFGPMVGTGKRFIVRYAQERFRDSLKGTITA